MELTSDRAAREIMTYFLQHSGVADSLEGIARWRLMLQRIDDTVDETAVALSLLVKEGFLEPVPGQPLFRLNTRKRKAAERRFGTAQGGRRP